MLEYLMLINRDVDYSARSDARAAQSAAGNALSRAEEVSNRLGAIELAVETLIRLGVDHNSFTEEEFFTMARKIDAEDGIVDGRRDLSRMTKLCPGCGKPNSGTKARCMWCEADLTDAKPVPNELGRL
jgi:hypothetical protein